MHTIVFLSQTSADENKWQLALLDTCLQLLLLAAPLIVLTILLHAFERIVQGGLIRKFGWSGVLWTAWIGTPIHELSHALMALLWGRRVLEVKLFQPDPKEGRLGYVRYTYRKNFLFDQIGNFFISTAPLVGGSLVLYGLLWLFFPSAAWEAFHSESIAAAMMKEGFGDVAQEFWLLSLRVLREVVTSESLRSWRLYLFIYLILCVGSHMAPSPVDYQGAKRGGWIIGGLLVVGLLSFNIIHLFAGGESGWLMNLLTPVMAPLLVLLAIGVLLCGLSSLLVAGLVHVAPGTRMR